MVPELLFLLSQLKNKSQILKQNFPHHFSPCLCTYPTKQFIVETLAAILYKPQNVMWTDSPTFSTITGVSLQVCWTFNLIFLLFALFIFQPLFMYFAQQAVHRGNYLDPLQAPAHYVNRFLHIKNIQRREYAGWYKV